MEQYISGSEVHSERRHTYLLHTFRRLKILFKRYCKTDWM